MLNVYLTQKLICQAAYVSLYVLKINDLVRTRLVIGEWIQTIRILQTNKTELMQLNEEQIG